MEQQYFWSLEGFSRENGVDNFNDISPCAKKIEPQRQFDRLAMDNFLGFRIKQSTLDEVESVLKNKNISYSVFPDYSKNEDKDIVFSFEIGNINWQCRLTIKDRILRFVSINNYNPNSYQLYKVLCSEMSGRFSSSHDISNSQNQMEGTETTCFTSKEDAWCFTEIVYDSSPILGQENVYIKYF